MEADEALAQHLAALYAPNAWLFTWHGSVRTDNLFETVEAWLESLGVRPASWREAGGEPQLRCQLHEVDEADAVSTIAFMTSVSQAYGVPGPLSAQQAMAFAEGLPKLIGNLNPRWWSNTDSQLTGWYPVTQHTFDAIVIGHSDELSASILAIDED